MLERDPRAVRRGDLDVADRLNVLPILRQEADDQIEPPLAFDDLGHRLASDGRLHDRVDIRHQYAVPGAGGPIHLDEQIRLSQQPEHAEIGDAENGLHHPINLKRRGLKLREITAEQLDRVLPLDSGHRFLDVVLNHLREIEGDSRKGLQLLLDLMDDPVLVEPWRPFVSWLEIDEKLGVEKARGVCPIVRATELRGHGLDRRVRAEDAPHLGRDPRCFVERDVHRHRRPHPEIALFQSRHELAAHQRQGQQSEEDQARGQRDRQASIAQRPAERGQIDALQPGHESRVLFGQRRLEQQRAQDRAERHGDQQRAQEREPVSDRHRREDLARDSDHRKERDERNQDDERGKENRPAHVPGRPHDRHPRRALRCRMMAVVAKLQKDRLDHDQCRVHDDPEVDGTERDEIGRLPHDDHHRKGEQEGEWHRERHN